MIEVKESKVSFDDIVTSLARINDCTIFNKNTIMHLKDAIDCVFAAANIKTILSDDSIDDPTKLARIKAIVISDLKKYDWEEELE